MPMPNHRVATALTIALMCVLMCIAAPCVAATPGAAPGTAPGAAPTAKPDADGFMALFDGKTLDGWVQRGGKANYSVEDGAIVGATVPNTANSFLCTKRDFGDFILEYDFNCDNGLNSGVQIRSSSYKAYQNGRVHGYQVEIDPDKPARRWTGGIYDEGRRGWLYPLTNHPEAQAAFKRGQWNHARVVAEGDRIRTWINGVPCADLVDSLTIEGFVALQVHGVGGRREPLQVRWRNIRIKPMGRHVWKPLWDGKTFDGWEKMPGGDWQIKQVEPGVSAIVGTNPPTDPRHGQLITKDRFKDFTIRVKYKAIKGNSGVYFRVDKVKSAVAVNGFQAEIDPDKDAGGLYETGGRAWVVHPTPEQVKKWYKPGAWNDMTVSAHGRRIVVHVNGYRTADLADDPGRLEGYIALQLHGGMAMDVQFRDIQILTKETQ